MGYIAVTVQGTYKGATAAVTREFQVVPKCCGLSFGSGQAQHGNDTRSCDANLPRIAVGLNGGGLLANGATSGEIRNISSDGLTSLTTNPSSILCVSSNAYCGAPGSPQAVGTTSASNLAVPINTIKLTVPPLPVYPTCPTGQTCTGSTGGFNIRTTSASDTAQTGSSAASATQSAINQDYVRINAGGQVEMCNVTSNNPVVASNGGIPVPPANFVGTCSTQINNFCAKLGSGTAANPFTYHCRITSVLVQDDTLNNTRNTSNTDRIQNNSLWIDSTVAPIYLYLNSEWNATGIDTVTSTNGQADGQIIHLKCATAVYTVPCGVTATQSNFGRVAFYSNTNIVTSIGDDGYIRNVFLYTPKGDLWLNNISGNPDSYGDPAFSGTMWVNNIAMNCGNGSTCGTGGGITRLSVAAASVSVSNGGGGTLGNLFYEPIVRSTASTSLF